MFSVLHLQCYCALPAASSLRIRANGAKDTLPGHQFEGICQKGYSVCYGVRKASMSLPGPLRQILQRKRMSAFRVTADVAARCFKRRE